MSSHCPGTAWCSTSEIVVKSHPLPLGTTPLGCVVEVVTGASLQVSVPRVRLGCPAIAWIVGGALSSLLRVHCGIKGIALCGVVLPSPPLWNGLALLCTATLRYSSLMFQDPHWTSVKALEHPLWFSCALSPSVFVLPPGFPLSFLRVELSLCWCFVLPLLLCPLSFLLLRLLCASGVVCAWMLS